MMVHLTTEHRVLVVEKFFRLRSYVLVKEAFALRFPDRQLPSKSTIERNVLKYQRDETSLYRNKGNSGRKRTVRSEQNIEAVRNQLEVDPHVTARRNGLGLSKSTFNRITEPELHFHPYRIQRRHEFQEIYFQRRINFCNWFVDRCRDFRFLANFVISDEGLFAMNGRVNTWKVREYGLQGHPPPFNYDRNESRGKLVVWGGMCGNGLLLEPFFIEGNLTGSFSSPVLRLWWAQDGAPPHHSRDVKTVLIEMCNNHVIAYGHGIEWPPRSPDLTCCD